MIVHAAGIKTNLLYLNSFDKSKDTILFLHGFTGCAEDWLEVSQLIDNGFNQIAIDIAGHGKTESPEDLTYYSAGNIVNQILQTIEYITPRKIILAGYSMGGRAALTFAVQHPEKIKALILESTSAGIENKTDQQSRIENDNNLAEFIESHSIAEFVDIWLDKEIFQSLKNLTKEKFNHYKNAKLQNCKIGLANSLRGFGTGKMPYTGSKLKVIDSPVLLITGELDKKFTKLNRELVQKFPNSKHIIIKNAGHNVHFEKPEEFGRSVNEFLISS